MDLNLEVPGHHHWIRGIGEAGIRVGERWYSASFLVSATRLVDSWPPQSVDQLNASHLTDIWALNPEVVLLGTGERQVFLPPEFMAHFYRQGVGIEVMSTQAACRTFNVLVSEERRVIAALMPATIG